MIPFIKWAASIPLKTKKYKHDDFEPALLLSEDKDYYAFHKDTPDALIQKFQAALDSLDKEHKELAGIYKIK